MEGVHGQRSRALAQTQGNKTTPLATLETTPSWIAPKIHSSRHHGSVELAPERVEPQQGMGQIRPQVNPCIVDLGKILGGGGSKSAQRRSTSPHVWSIPDKQWPRQGHISTCDDGTFPAGTPCTGAFRFPLGGAESPAMWCIPVRAQMAEYTPSPSSLLVSGGPWLCGVFRDKGCARASTRNFTTRPLWKEAPRLRLAQLVPLHHGGDDRAKPRDARRLEAGIPHTVGGIPPLGDVSIHANFRQTLP